MFIDLHAHILPKLDDGPQSVEISLSMLKRMSEQGISTVVATPHYYSEAISIENFLIARKNAYNDLINAAKEKEITIPRIILGAEVHLTSDVAYSQDINKLAIENTNCILIEMPFGFWSNWVLDSIYNFVSQKEPLTPILAHIERYINPSNLKIVNSLLSMDIYTQVNTGSFSNSYKDIVAALHTAQAIHILGTDCHNDKNRAPSMNIAHAFIQKKYGEPFFDALMQNSADLLDNKLPFRAPLDLELKKKGFMDFFKR